MANREYLEALAWLYGLEAARGMDFKLERVALALKSLGDPQAQFASVLIAGTNGKGSVAAMVHAMFNAAGYRVGLYTSPHLVGFTERIRVGTGTITEESVVELVHEIRAAATVRGIDLTFFEFVTVMAFLHFARRGVDLAVVEVGLGGRLDATNTLAPAVAVITTIGLDHEEFLGNTLESVAREKAGIITSASPVVVGNLSAEAWEIVRRAAAAQGAAVYRAGRDFSLCLSRKPFRFSGMGCELSDIELSLRGAFQQENASTAIACAMLLRQQLPIAEEAVRRGLATVSWPGRLEVVEREPLVVLDGAHNADGIAALVRELPEIVGARSLHVLFAVMRDKRWQPMVETIAASAATVTVTTALPPRGEAPDVLARAFEPYCTARIAAEPMPALQELLRAAGNAEAIVVTGSLFLVGAVYPYFLSRRAQPDLFVASSTLHP